MTTDRELLEWAAKAAGIEVYESTDGTLQNRPILVFAAGGGMGTMPYEERWNPLCDDAQALRLAVKLRIDIEWRGDGRVSCYQHLNDEGFCYPNQCESSRENAEANLRRAIVRAAASIGQQMEK